MSITFVVDVWPGEPDILRPLSNQPLRVLSETGAEVFTAQAPDTGWSQVALEHITRDITESPLDAYLGADWVGSTEV